MVVVSDECATYGVEGSEKTALTGAAEVSRVLVKGGGNGGVDGSSDGEPRKFRAQVLGKAESSRIPLRDVASGVSETGKEGLKESSAGFKVNLQEVLHAIAFRHGCEARRTGDLPPNG